MENPHNPERQSPDINVRMNGESVSLNYFNTDVYVYRRPFQHLNHIFFHPEGQPSGAFIFGNEQLIRGLRKAKFRTHKAPWPEPADEEAYVQYQMRQLDKELEGHDA